MTRTWFLVGVVQGSAVGTDGGRIIAYYTGKAVKPFNLEFDPRLVMAPARCPWRGRLATGNWQRQNFGFR